MHPNEELSDLEPVICVVCLFVKVLSVLHLGDGDFVLPDVHING